MENLADDLLLGSELLSIFGTAMVDVTKYGKCYQIWWLLLNMVNATKYGG